MSDLHPSDGRAALIALALVLAGKIADSIMPNGWHLKIIRWWAEPDTKDDEEDTR